MGSVVLSHTFLNVFLKVLGKVPTISINKTEGCQVYLSKESLHCDIVSAKSSEMNILVPQEDDEFVSVADNSVCCLWCANLVLKNTIVRFSFSVLQKEFPVPEQFKTVWDGSKLATEPTEIAG